MTLSTFRTRIFPQRIVMPRTGLKTPPVAAALALLAAAVLAPGTGRAADWTLDKAASKIAFSGVQVGAPFTGHFKSFDAKISFDPDHPEAGHAVVLIDMTSAESGDPQRDEAMPQSDWFDAATNKQARFEATRFVAKGKDDYEAVGTLTIRGTSHDATLPFHLTIADKKAHATGHLDLVRTAYGVGQNAWASDQWVAFGVGVDVDIVATQ